MKHASRHLSPRTQTSQVGLVTQICARAVTHSCTPKREKQSISWYVNFWTTKCSQFYMFFPGLMKPGRGHLFTKQTRRHTFPGWRHSGARIRAHTASGGSPCTPPVALPNVKTQQGRRASAERPTCLGETPRHKLPADTSPAPLQASRLSVGTILATGETHLWSFLFGNL